jgi:hypothetical protein
MMRPGKSSYPPDQSDDAAAGLRGLGNGSRPLVTRSVATQELGSSVSFKQVLRMVGSSFGTAVAAAVRAANTAPDLHSTGEGISTTFATGALLCGTAFLSRFPTPW